ncbi:DUF1214 domain-containing protein [Methylobacterium sp. J-076]|uniref:DUF1214 domain-containing protein n=1 Tax=Methylobacterium sp. J-076 TaxID=2836655 RepID=UPI001FBAF56C|nr:DUF1214 domain-containing protein [Methylobacterium sp. J-076]MCJ2014520.1 DUF1214 domain-containing protein [Methylobacterium sp. J-076]
MKLARPGRDARLPAPGRPTADPVHRPVTPGGVGRLVIRFARKSGTPLLALYALVLGAVLGLGSADWATRGGYPFGGVRIGAWTAWPRAGALTADPYTRAVNARRGEVPLAVGEGLLLTAAEDDEGRTLDAACTYSVAGAVPPARAWTLTVAGRGPRDPARPHIRDGFTSTEILRQQNGRFVIVVAPEVEAGNWLPSPRAEGPMRLALRLYDTPAAANAASLDRGAVPSITRKGCAP